MTEINIQRKSSNAIMWVVVILAVLVVLWLVFGWGFADASLTTLAPDGEPVALGGSAARVTFL